MYKKIFVCLCLFLILISSMCFATNLNDALTSLNLFNEDLFVSEDNYKIDNSIYGNAFITSKNFTVDSTNNGGIISGDLFIISNSVDINSTKSEDGSTLSNSKIYGNVFALADTFTLDEGCSINGDLYFLGTTLDLKKGSQIGGSIFVNSTNVTINSQISGSCYINSKNFTMDYDSYIYNDLNLNSKNVTLNGQIRRNCNVSSKDFNSLYGFKVDGNLLVESEKINYAGECVQNATLNAKNVHIDNSASTCLIRKNLNYSSNSEININKENVLGEINYSKYKPNTPGFGKVLLNKFLGFITFLTYVLVISFLINKFMPKLANKNLDLKVKNLLISFGIGFGILILVPIIAFLLLIARVTSILSIFVFTLYLLMLTISMPVFINTLANKYTKKNVYLNILVLTCFVWIINLIPYLGFIVSLILLSIGLGMIFKRK